MNKKFTPILMRKVMLLSAIFFLALTYSCKKDGALNPDFDNGNLSVNYIDTFSLKTTLIEEDSLRTDLSIYHLLGLYNDQNFGKVSSSIYTQLLLTGVNVSFGTLPVLDSAVLTLAYQGVYGDTSTPMNVNVYEVTTKMDKSTNYYSNTYLDFASTAIGNLSFVPNTKDSVSIGFDLIKRAPHVRIPLSNTFGQALLNAGSGNLANNAAFTDHMRGLYITSVDSVNNTTLLPGTGSIAYFNMNSALSTVTLYYNDTSKYDFSISTDGVKYSRFAHNYTGTDIEKHLPPVNPSRDTTVTYLSTMAGVKVKLEIPYIKELLKEGNVIINKAELVLTLEDGVLYKGDFDKELASISLVGIDANGDAFFIPDFYEGQDYYGGSYNLTSKTYKFNLARHINDLLYNTTTDYGMYLIANGGTVTSNRSIIGSSTSPNTSKMRLNITYTKL
jgi:hypothetical protein